MHKTRKSQPGFTLVEVLVALLVAAVVAILSFRGIDALITADRHLATQSARWLEVHRFLSTIEMDLRLAPPRVGRDAGGTVQPALVGLAAAGRPFGAHLSLMQINDGPGAPIRRVAYRLKGEQIELLRWPAADLSPYGEPHVLLALDGVRNFSVRYLGSDRVWRDAWFPANQVEMPKGFSVRLELADPLFSGPVERVIAR